MTLAFAGFLGVCLLMAASLLAFIATRDYAAVRADLVRTIERDLPGRVTIGQVRPNLFPLPYLSIENLTIESIDGSFALAAPSAMATIEPLDLIEGRLDRPNLRIAAAQVRLAAGDFRRLGQSPREIVGLVDQISRAFDQRPALAALRVRLDGARLLLAGAATDGGDLSVAELQARLRYDRKRGRIDLRARRGGTEPAEIGISLPTRQSLTAGGRDSAFVEFIGQGSRLGISGRIARSSEFAATGTIELALGPALESRLGLAAARETGTEPAAGLQLSAATVIDSRGANFENLRIQRGGASLAGIAALRENNGRWSLSSTLAGDLVDGSAAEAALRRLTGPAGQWAESPLDIDPLPGVDLDIRLSTRVFRLGQIALEDAALSIFTRAGRAEVAVADARFGDGQVKARAVLSHRGDLQELKLSLSGERLEAERFLEAAFGLSRLRGRGGFVLQAESLGRGAAGLAANLVGSATVDIQRGEIVGIDLPRLVGRSSEVPSEAALLAALGGRSPFEALTLNLAIRNGIAEPVGVSLKAARYEGGLEGAIDLGRRRVMVWGLVRPRVEQASPANDLFAVRIEGPLFAPVLKPDPAYLLKRS